MRSAWPTLLAVVLAFVLGAAALQLYQGQRRARQLTEDSSVLLERVRGVLKMVTVEGDIHEIYNSTQSRDVTLYLPLPTRFSFDKRATVEVRGTVLVGYDLEKLDLRVEADSRRVLISNLPEPEILAIDHELDYRDLEESWFNTFTARDYSELNRRAKEVLRNKALESRLTEEAARRGGDVLEGLRFLVEGAGYELVVTPGSLPSPHEPD